MPIMDIIEDKFIKMFLDFDKNSEKFYVNYFFEKFKIVLKVSLIRDKGQEFVIKFDKFNLTKYTFLVSFE